MSETRTKVHKWVCVTRAAMQMALKILKQHKCEIVVYRILEAHFVIDELNGFDTDSISSRRLHSSAPANIGAHSLITLHIP